MVWVRVEAEALMVVWLLGRLALLLVFEVVMGNHLLHGRKRKYILWLFLLEPLSERIKNGLGFRWQKSRERESF